MQTANKKQKKMLSLELIRRLPKAELHCHLDGSVRVETLIELAREQKVELPSFDVAELRKLVSVDLNCPSLVEYLRGFDISLSVLQKAYAITRVMYEVCEDAVADGVRYLEVRFSPILHTKEGMGLSQVMDAICEGAFMAEFRLPITVRIIVCGMRHLSSNVTENLAEIACRYQNKGVVAFDLAGPEFGFSSKNHRSAFKIVRDKLLNCTLHSGEAAGWESIWDSLRYCGAHRIGHGVRLHENEELLKYVIDQRICLESCVTSNIQTKAVDTFAEHPIKRFLDAGVVIVPCTDNVTVSGVTLSGEYHLLQTEFQCTVDDIVKMIDYGFQSAFIDSTLRQRIRAEALNTVITILKKEGFDVSRICENHKYFDSVGIYFDEMEKCPYWGGAPHVEITKEDIRHLPKADLHVRLDGSVRPEAMLKELADPAVKEFVSKNLGVEVNSLTDLHNLLCNHDSEENAKQLSLLLLQNEAQIRRGIDDVFEDAKNDSVIYMEVHVRPTAHTLCDLTIENVLDIALDQCAKAGAAHNIKWGVVPTVLNGRDSPLMFQRVAEVAVSKRGKGVVGFGVYGSKPLLAHEYQYFQDTFRYLKLHSLKTVIAAGKEEIGSINASLHEGGAARICGGYAVHQDPVIMDYLATHHIPVEVNASTKLDHLTHSISSFNHFVRLMLDMNIPVAISSFRKSLYPASRSEILLKLTKSANLSIHELLKVLGTSIRSSFQGYQDTIDMYEQFYNEATEYLSQRGFSYFKEKHYFPEHSN